MFCIRFVAFFLHFVLFCFRNYFNLFTFALHLLIIIGRITYYERNKFGQKSTLKHQ